MFKEESEPLHRAPTGDKKVKKWERIKDRSKECSLKKNLENLLTKSESYAIIRMFQEDEGILLLGDEAPNVR